MAIILTPEKARGIVRKSIPDLVEGILSQIQGKILKASEAGYVSENVKKEGLNPLIYDMAVEQLRTAGYYVDHLTEYMVISWGASNGK